MTVFQATSFFSGSSDVSATSDARLWIVATSALAASTRWKGNIHPQIDANIFVDANGWVFSTKLEAKFPASSSLSVNAKLQRPVVKTTAGINRLALKETDALVAVILDALLDGMAYAGSSASALRRQAGYVKANVRKLVIDNTLGTGLLACFEEAQAAGSSIENMENVRATLLDEHPKYDLAIITKMSAVIFCLVEECKIIAGMEFRSRNDVDRLMVQMSIVVDDIKLDVSESAFDASNYEFVVSLSAALMQHLAATERQLPRIVHYDMAISLPSLTIADRLYGDASRSEELIDENKTVHPAFMTKEVSALAE